MTTERFVDFFGIELLENDAQALKDFYKNHDFLTKDRNQNMEKTMKSLFRRKKINADSKRISTIHMSAEKIFYFPEEICALDALEDLSFRNNHISELPKEAYKLSNLVHFGIGANSIGLIPRGISKLKKLETLDLEECYLRNFPKEITRLENLKKLYLSHNSGENFLVPPEIGRMKNLKELYLIDVELKSLSKKILELENLKKIDIRHKNMNYNLLKVIDKLEQKGVKVHYEF